jgi:rSAM/selenodomain-associated transferase 2
LISVIVPIKSEGPEVAERFARFARSPDAELVVVCESEASPPGDALGRLGARLLRADGNRGRRLDRAARAAGGEFLFFVHADSRPPEDALALIRGSLVEGAVAGAFSLAYENAGAALRWIAWWANVRSRLLRLPFGDQGLFCRRDAYERAGGFRDLPICDDVDLVRRLKRVGRLTVRREKTVTSARRYRERGAVRQVLLNWRVLAGYYAGVSPERLARWYNAR